MADIKAQNSTAHKLRAGAACIIGLRWRLTHVERAVTSEVVSCSDAAKPTLATGSGSDPGHMSRAAGGSSPARLTPKMCNMTSRI